jgi:5,10-methylene-tetrahydrofolate dehydrogenase/methenyl tetrahydrofolate cyclohydrolase
MELLDGTKVANEILDDLKNQVENLKKKGVDVCLGIILVGNRKDSESYVRMKKKRCQEIGITNFDVQLPENITEEELLEHVERMNQNPFIHGMLVQLPLPPHINSERVISKVSVEKDVDGFHPINFANLALQRQPEKTIFPCTPEGIIYLLDSYQIPIEGKDVVVVGKSNIVGLPMALMMMHNGATVTVCHSKTKNLKQKTSKGDILIVACGQPEMITSEYVKEGAVVIDVGINSVEDETKKCGYRIVGDVNFEFVEEKCTYLTPVPGGVGPMTIAMLLAHTVKLASSG